MNDDAKYPECADCARRGELLVCEECIDAAGFELLEAVDIQMGERRVIRLERA